MTVEYFGEKIFLDEVEASQQVWVARNNLQMVYTEDFDRKGFSLPVWSNQERVIEYLRNALLVGPKYEPHSLPLDVFVNAWLSDKQKGILELLINPDGKSTRVLALTSEEFQASQGAK